MTIRSSGVQRRSAAERDQRAAGDFLAALDRMHARGVRHILFDDFDDTVRGLIGSKAKRRTDRCIERACALAGPGCVVVKRAKPQQDLRLDLPTIGPGTVEIMRNGKASVLILEAGRSLVLERQRVIAEADVAGIAIAAASTQDEIA